MICDGGGGEHRAVLRCDKPWPPDYTRYGPWQPNGRESSAVCSDMNKAYDLKRETRIWT